MSVWYLVRMASLPGLPAPNSLSHFIVKVCGYCDDVIHRKQEVSTSSRLTDGGKWRLTKHDESREDPAAFVCEGWSCDHQSSLDWWTSRLTTCSSVRLLLLLLLLCWLITIWGTHGCVTRSSSSSSGITASNALPGGAGLQTRGSERRREGERSERPAGGSLDDRKQTVTTPHSSSTRLIYTHQPGSCDWPCPEGGKVLRTVRLPSPSDCVGVAYMTVCPPGYIM